jgi:hypothetical protein
MEPAPERKRKTTWKEFLSRLWEQIVADFFTVEIWTKRGLQSIMVLFFIDLATRKVEIAGVASVADGLWMRQIGRNVTDAMEGVLRGKRYLIHDRDPLFTRGVRPQKMEITFPDHRGRLVMGVGPTQISRVWEPAALRRYKEHGVSSAKPDSEQRSGREYSFAE